LRKPSTICAWASGRQNGARLRTYMSEDAGLIAMAFSRAPLSFLQSAKLTERGRKPAIRGRMIRARTDHLLRGVENSLVLARLV